MMSDYIELYLLGINVIGFAAYLLSVLVTKHRINKIMQLLLTAVALIGGSIGMAVAMVVFDRKAVKDNMLIHILLTCIIIIQLIVLFMISGYHKTPLDLNIFGYVISHHHLLIYLCVINCLTFIVYALDKAKAVHHQQRIPIITLIAMAYIGGSIGALAAMMILHHKTRKDYFMVGVPVIVVMQIAVLFFVMNLPLG